MIKNLNNAFTDFLSLWKYMVMAREVDILERAYCRRGEAFFTIGGEGHEGTVALAPFLTNDDWLHPHYRDKALLLARGLPLDAFFYSLFAKQKSQFCGQQLPDFFCDPRNHILSMCIPVANNCLQAVGAASVLKEKGAGLVYCSVGDGGTQQGEFYEAISQAVRLHLPVLFLIQDNHYALSSKTKGKTIFSLPTGLNTEFLGLSLRNINGQDVISASTEFDLMVKGIRKGGGPAIAVIHCERLCDHSNADDHRIYRSAEEIKKIESEGDPIHNLKNKLLKSGHQEEELRIIRETIKQQVLHSAELAQTAEEPFPLLSSKKLLPAEQAIELFSERDDTSYSMAEAINGVLKAQLKMNPQVFLYGEDIEDPKGDVFKVTRGLSTVFPDQVKNSPLSEATIIGYAIGMALLGKKPVVFIQFGDFLPLALNQLYSELATMYWRTRGKFEAPVILMVTCGGYKPGLGPFHSASMEALASHIPGLDVILPSNAQDAAGLLNAAFASGRPTVFFYPKNLLHNKDLSTSGLLKSRFVPLGKAQMLHQGKDLTLVSWGNPILLCMKAVEIFKKENISVEVIDLRCISPWDASLVLSSASKTGRLLIVQEDNETLGFASEIIAVVAEKLKGTIEVSRLTRADVFLPYNFANQLEVLPSLQKLIEKIAAMLRMSVRWDKPETGNLKEYIVNAGSFSPSDDSVTVMSWKIKPGQKVSTGELLLELESSKSVLEMESPVTGTVLEILIPENTVVKVGTPLVRMELENPILSKKPLTQEIPGRPVFSRHQQTPAPLHRSRTNLDDPRRNLMAGILGIASSIGSLTLSNEDLIRRFSEKSCEEIVNLTGIQSRSVLAPGENSLTLAVNACKKLFSQQNVLLEDIDLILCSTGTPLETTPSLACRVLRELSGGASVAPQIPAYDISAACSGFIYGLSASYDFLYAKPYAKVLLITAEALTTKVDPQDFGTVSLFGDAATATLLVGNANLHLSKGLLNKPLISAKGEDGTNLSVPLCAEGKKYLKMNGHAIFAEAVRNMTAILKRACHDASIPLEALDLVVPHQANFRIIDAIRNKAGLPPEKMWTQIRDSGNTSSSSIPLCLNRILPDLPPDKKIGICAFGGGYTFGACIIETREPSLT